MSNRPAFRDRITLFSIDHPWLVIGVTLIITLAFAYQFPKIHFDNDPENMLSPDEPVRVFHNKVKKRFALYDFVIAGIVNEKDPDGVFNPDTLQRIHRLTLQLMNLHRRPDGKVAVRTPTTDGTMKEEIVDLTPASAWLRMLNFAFRRNPQDLFDPMTGESVIIGPEIISPSVVDNIKQAKLGSLKVEYLMEKPPKTREEARRIRDDALNNPLYRDTLVSADGKALCLYVPIRAKHYSYNVTQLIKYLTRDWPREDRLFFTGLPVAEDTFGVEMLIQMATSAPMAGLVVFLLLLLFFRRLQLILAPMIIAIISIIWAMGLLIGLGYDVHIMSSMIAIFLMPIAVCDSVHMLSEFYDTYQRFRDKRKTILHIVHHLFMPMLYTSLTTIAGFASLATTPIPPVKVFGLHVAFGVAVAWVLTVTFVPAFIMVFMRNKSLESFGTQQASHHDENSSSSLMAILGRIAGFTFRHAKLIITMAVVILVFSAVGISKIKINDNPVKWFTASHPIRIADRVLNEHFGGTYTAYLVFSPQTDTQLTCHEKIDAFRRHIKAALSPRDPEGARLLLAKLDE
ncbi:MAG: hypothetical protein D6820_00560, partial [Lentisphaerae bacterium]